MSARIRALMSCIATDEQSSTEAKRGCSAVGSASPCQGEGRGFESRHPLEGAKASAPVVEWPSGEATACKAVHTGSIPVSTSTSFQPGAISSAGERFPDTEEVTGSIPVSRTRVSRQARFSNRAFLLPHDAREHRASSNPQYIRTDARFFAEFEHRPAP